MDAGASLFSLLAVTILLLFLYAFTGTTCIAFNTHINLLYLWGQELNANRPPTPTRGRPQVANDRGPHAWI